MIKTRGGRGLIVALVAGGEFRRGEGGGGLCSRRVRRGHCHECQVCAVSRDQRSPLFWRQVPMNFRKASA